MCTIFVAPKMRTELSADAFRYQDVNVKQTEQTEDRKRQLSMKWVAVETTPWMVASFSETNVATSRKLAPCTTTSKS